MRVIYGVNPVLEALKAEVAPEKVLVFVGRSDRRVEALMKRADSRGVAVERVGRDELDRRTGGRAHQGVVALASGGFGYASLDGLIAAWKSSAGPALFVLLDSIQDPGNLGSIIRTCVAAGVHGIVIPKKRACPVTPAVVKASAGAAEHALIAREVNLSSVIERLKRENVWVAAVDAAGPEDLYEADLNRDLALVIGSEGRGIRRLVRRACDFCVAIPMAGPPGSLNAAQAAAVAVFEAVRQRSA